MKIIKLNKKGNAIGFTFALISFIFIWAVWLGAELNTYGAQYIANNNPGSLEIIFYGYLNLWVFIGLAIGTFSYFYYSGS
jgi:hypothetical protein